ncbi:MAG: 3'-5' exonuclease [Bacteroidales bacterium]|nr:3'-5' exonuclease [Bacteroidales bacterium]
MKNIVCFDTETTGVDTQKDKIIQIAMVKFDRNNFETIDKLNSYIIPDGEWDIPQEAIDVHGLTKDFILKNGVPIKEIANKIINFFNDCDILTYNGNSFDVAILLNNLNAIGINWNLPDCKYYDAFIIEKQLHSFKLTDVYKRYYNEDFAAHDAFADVNATIKVFKKQLEINQEQIENSNLDILSPEGFIKRNDSGEIVFAKGKYANKTIYEICKTDKDYINWLWYKSNISEITKNNIKKAYQSKNNK